MLSIDFKHIFCIPIFAAYFHTSSRLCLRVLSGCVFFPSLSTAISQRRMEESAILLVAAFRSTSWNLRACAPVFFSFMCAPLSAKKKDKKNEATVWRQRGLPQKRFTAFSGTLPDAG